MATMDSAQFDREKFNSSQLVIQMYCLLKQLVTGDEKWIIYNNVERNRFWDKRNELPLTTPNADLHPNKIMLYVWLDWKRISMSSTRRPVEIDMYFVDMYFATGRIKNIHSGKMSRIN